MATVSVYQLTISALEVVLPKLLEKVLETDKRSVVLLSSDERVDVLNDVLWTYSSGAFLPHGTVKDGFAEHQPIWITAKVENPNHADILFLADGAAVDSLEGFERCFDVFDSSDPEAEVQAQERIQSYLSDGHQVTYWLQGDDGKWCEKSQG